MSYDLCAWREERDLGLSPDQVMSMLEEEGDVPGVAGIPVAEIKAAFGAVFPDIDDGRTELNWEGAGSYFQVTFSYASFQVVSLVSISCGFQLLNSPETVEKLIGVC